MPIKTRDYKQELTASQTTVYGGSYTDTYTGKSTVYTESQRILTQNNPVQFIGRGVDVGGPWLNNKITVTLPQEELALSNAPGDFYGRSCRGIPFPGGGILDNLRVPYTQSGLVAACPTPVSDSDLKGWGTSAIAGSAPTNPHVDMATALAELASGVPEVPGRVGKRPGTVSGEVGGNYLNIQFGLVPTVNDMKKFRKVRELSDKYRRQYRRDAGRIVRRRVQGPESSSETSTVQNGVYLTMAGSVTPTIHLQQAGTLTTTHSTVSKRWFSGAFQYFLPKEATARQIAELDHLYGVMPDLTTVWNVVPFTWLLDWQTNLGDMVKNMSQFSQDGLVMPWGYVMHETVRRSTYRLENQVCEGGQWRPNTTSVTVEFKTQQRLKATPFGFNVNDGLDLSARQIAILAALGMSLR